MQAVERGLHCAAVVQGLFRGEHCMMDVQGGEILAHHAHHRVGGFVA